MAQVIEAAHRRIEVRVEEDVGAVRRAVAEIAGPHGRVVVASVQLAATELATNLVRHASGGGYVLYRGLDDGVELLAVDRGPGMGRSPTAGLGAGLAGVGRAASTYDLYSSAAGTVVLARLHRRRPPTPRRFRWGAVSVPFAGEEDSGDAWAVAEGGSLAVLVVDGLGHGPRAAEPARAALAVFREDPFAPIEAFVRRAHDAMRPRGGVLGRAVVDPRAGLVSWCAVGNIAGRILRDPESRRLLMRNGTVGTQLQPPPARVLEYPWGTGATLVLTTDGVSDRWASSSYPGLFTHDPSVVAATLHRDHGRATDDATVLAVQDISARME